MLKLLPASPSSLRLGAGAWRCLLVALALCLASASLVVAQAVEPQQEGVPETEVAAGFENGVGRLMLEGRESALEYTLTLTGELFPLQALAARLGGEIIVGPLGKSHTLDVFGTQVVIGAESPVMTIGDEIVPLSRMPLARARPVDPEAAHPSGLNIDLMVPVDFLRRTWGELAGYSFRWDRPSRTLIVDRRVSRDLSISLDLVHIAGVSTLVVRLRVDDPNARFETIDGGFELVFPGDRLDLRGLMPRPVAMVQNVQVLRDRIRVQLDADASAAEPYQVDRNGVQLIVDIARGRPQSGPTLSNRLPTLGVPTRGNEMRIVLDPGHGGSEVGAVGTRGTLEKDLTLRLARRLRDSLQRRMPVRVLLTRESDVAVPHETRTAIANQNEADLFISLHLNSVPGGGGTGAETYFLNLEASDRGAEEAARFENGTDATDDGLQLMLWDLAQSKHMAQSQAFARLVQSELNGALGLRDRGVKQAPFRVLVGAAMPAVLVEFGFLSNPDEEAKLQQTDYQGELVDAIVRAVLRYREIKLRGNEGLSPAGASAASGAAASAPPNSASPDNAGPAAEAAEPPIEEQR